LNKLVLIVEFDVKPEHLVQFGELISINAKASVADEPGCRQFDVLQDQDNPNRVVLYEVYDDAAAFQDHLGHRHTQTFLAAAKPLINKQMAYKLKRTVAPPVKPNRACRSGSSRRPGRRQALSPTSCAPLEAASFRRSRPARTSTSACRTASFAAIRS
jgi:autoinducer 2-degrading protein